MDFSNTDFIIDITIAIFVSIQFRKVKHVYSIHSLSRTSVTVLTKHLL